jgi:hypothetical protein
LGRIDCKRTPCANGAAFLREEIAREHAKKAGRRVDLPNGREHPLRRRAAFHAVAVRANTDSFEPPPDGKPHVADRADRFYAALIVELFNAFRHTIDGWTAVVPTGLILSRSAAPFLRSPLSAFCPGTRRGEA